MVNKIQLKYDELNDIMKKMRSESDDVALMLSRTRQMVINIQQEWIGRGAKEFAREMDQKLLPGLKKLAEALNISQDALRKIIRIIQEADQDNAKLFKKGLTLADGVRVSAAAGIGAAIGGVVSTGGAGVQFSERVRSVAGSVVGAGMGAEGSASGAASDSEAGGASGSATSGAAQGATTGSGGGAEQVSKKMADAVSSTGGGGGGGSSGSGAGGKGDLGGLSTGSGTSIGSAASGAGVSGKVTTGMPDHIYQSSPAATGPGGGGQTPPVSGKGGGIGPQGGQVSVKMNKENIAAASLGVGGAAIGKTAAGKAGKGLRGKKE